MDKYNLCDTFDEALKKHKVKKFEKGISFQTVVVASPFIRNF